MITNPQNIKQKIAKKEPEISIDTFKTLFLSKQISIKELNKTVSIKSAIRYFCEIAKQKVIWSVLILIVVVVVIFLIDLSIYIFGSLFLVKWVPQSNRLIITLSINLQLILTGFMVFFCVLFIMFYNLKYKKGNVWKRIVRILSLVSFAVFWLLIVFIVLHKISFAIVGLIVRYTSGHCELLTALPCDTKTFKFLDLFIIYAFIEAFLLLIISVLFAIIGICFVFKYMSKMEMIIQEISSTSKTSNNFDNLIASSKVRKAILNKVTKLGFDEFIPNMGKIQNKSYNVNEPLIKN
jgi:hypothetical protein